VIDAEPLDPAAGTRSLLSGLRFSSLKTVSMIFEVSDLENPPLRRSASRSSSVHSAPNSGGMPMIDNHVGHIDRVASDHGEQADKVRVAPLERNVRQSNGEHNCSKYESSHDGCSCTDRPRRSIEAVTSPIEF
jgi:hypothetical protein